MNTTLENALDHRNALRGKKRSSTIFNEEDCTTTHNYRCLSQLGLLFAFWLFGAASLVEAGIAGDGPGSIAWATKIQGTDFIYVNIPPLSVEEESQIFPAINPEKSIRLRAKYKASGLYTADAPPKLLWEFIEPGGLSPPPYISKDGRFMVVPGDFSTQDYPFRDSIIAEFYDRGKSKSHVRYSDIASLPGIKSRFFAPRGFIRVISEEFSISSNAYIIKTNVGETIVFDAATGKVKKYHDPIFIYFLIAGSILGSLALLLLVIVVKKVRSHPNLWANFDSGSVPRKK